MKHDPILRVNTSQPVAPMFRYRLRTLLILMAVGPALLAVAWWLTQFVVGHQPHPTLVALLLIGHFASWIAGPVLWYYEIESMS